jgi:GNAT superfamily N-acetyltransferase
VTPDSAVYLYEGITEPAERGGGVGAALLDRSLAWARERGADHCTLHYATANPTGRPFWLKHGFRPLEHDWVRQVDERVAWARPRDGAGSGEEVR